MMKKHKIQIYVKPDGSASCIIDDTVPSTMSSTDGKVVMLQRPRSEVGRAEGGQTMTHGHHQQSAGGAASSFTEEETQGVSDFVERICLNFQYNNGDGDTCTQINAHAKCTY